MNDLRYALRQLVRQPSYTLVVVATFALGIGATTAIFSVVNGILLRPLPYPDADRVARIHATVEGGLSTVSPPNFVDWRREARAIGRMAAYHSTSITLTGDGLAERLPAARVTPGFFEVLGIPPAHGSGFAPEHETAGADRVVVLSDGLWRRRFGADPAIVGRTIELNDEAFLVTGIMPAGLDYPAGVELWVPRSFTADDLATQRGAQYLRVIGRLAPGATLDAAQTELEMITQRLAAAYPEQNTGMSVAVVSLKESIVGDLRRPLWVLLGAVGLVLLVACVNVANLGLARSLARERELAVRAALGAGRRQIVRVLLMESVLLALLGGLAGVLLAVWGTALIVGLRGDALPRAGAIGVDLTVLGFALSLSIIAGLAAGIVPAARLLGQRDVVRSLREGGRGHSGGRGGARLRSALVVAQLALALVLLGGAGLLMRSLVNLTRVDPGHRIENLLTFTVALPEARYPEPADARVFYAGMLERVAALPGVDAAGGVFGLPLSGMTYVISVELLDGQPAYDAPGEERSVLVHIATPNYFRTLGIVPLHGRGIDPTDREDAPRAVVVNEMAARLLWPGEDPLGHTIEVGTRLGLGGARVGGEVVGVVPDAHYYGPAEPAVAEIWAPHAQFPIDYMTFGVRTTGDPQALARPIREAVAGLDPDVPIFGVQTMEERLGEALAAARFNAVLIAVFAGAALLLGAIGIYGVMAFIVRERTRELGVRMALGAQPKAMFRLVLSRGLRLTLIGVGLGLAGAVPLTRTLRGLVFELSPGDPVTLFGAALLLGLVALLASWIPARRATRVDPMEALRYE